MGNSRPTEGSLRMAHCCLRRRLLNSGSCEHGATIYAFEVYNAATGTWSPVKASPPTRYIYGELPSG